MVASEARPFAKVGGLGEVVPPLAAALSRLGLEVIVYLPAYRLAGDYPTICSGVTGTVLNGVKHRFIVSPRHFDRPGIYGDDGGVYPDNPERFIHFARAALDAMEAETIRPDILHLHDWETSLIPPTLATRLADRPAWRGVKSVLTIHNLAYQGQIPAELFPTLGLPDRLMTREGLEYWGGVNLLKGGILFADAVTTVSGSYALEIATPAFGEGLEGVIRDRGDVVGIENGIDGEYWNPSRDPLLPVLYSAEDPGGKAVCKAIAAGALGLDPELPLAAFVGRLVGQKGVDLLIDAVLAIPPNELAVAVLGSGEGGSVAKLTALAAERPASFAFVQGLNEPMAHQLYAAADLFLMPSRFEPCGLSQMIALKYGAIPVVSPVGGLKDTVQAIDEASGAGTGIFLDTITAEGLTRTIRRGLAILRDPALRERVVHRGMSRSFSWDRPARAYLDLYRSLVEKP
jgi:starch synthase